MVRAVLFSLGPGRPREDFLNSMPQLQPPPSMPTDFLAPQLAQPRREHHLFLRPRRERHPVPKMHLVLATSTAEAAGAAGEAEGCLLVRQGFPAGHLLLFLFVPEVLAEDGLSSNCPARKWGMRTELRKLSRILAFVETCKLPTCLLKWPARKTPIMRKPCSNLSLFAMCLVYTSALMR